MHLITDNLAIMYTYEKDGWICRAWSTVSNQFLLKSYITEI
jgi:hypothetical protein